MASILEDIKQAVIKGGLEEEVERLTRQAVTEGYDVNKILQDGLIAGIGGIEKLWNEGEAFIPDVLFSAKAMQAGMGVIRQSLVKSGIKPLGSVVIGTVKDDVHDIGKSLVGLMLESFGFEVHDLGADVAAEKFVDAARTHRADMVCMSALLTTTMPNMENIIKSIRKAGLGPVIMVGGAPVSQEYANKIGANGYAPDAFAAVGKAKELLEIRG